MLTFALYANWRGSSMVGATWFNVWAFKELYNNGQKSLKQDAHVFFHFNFLQLFCAKRSKRSSSRWKRQTPRLVTAGPFGFLWMCLLLLVRVCKEESAMARLPLQRLRETFLSLKWEVISCVIPICFLDGPGRLGSFCSQAGFLSSSDAVASFPLQPFVIPGQAWLLVGPNEGVF